MSINEILKKENIPDKPDFFATTSYKFKEDLYNYFAGDYFKSKKVLELGTSKGYTAKLLSYLFAEVHTVNKKHDSDTTTYLDSSNIHLHTFDLYSYKAKQAYSNIPAVDVYVIDALHSKWGVTYDLVNCLQQNPTSSERYIVFDDYGTYPEVKEAIDEAIQSKVIKVQKYIGHSKGWSYGPVGVDTERILKDWEGLICQIV